MWTTLGLMAALAGSPTVPPGQPPSPVASSEALITNTGSTNTTGYRITVEPSGQVSYQVTHLADGGDEALKHTNVPKALAQKLFHDLQAAMPLAQLPMMHTFKSVSFGTSAYIQYKGQRTPDMSSPADARGQALLADVTQIAATLHMSNTPRHPIGPLTPMLPGH